MTLSFIMQVYLGEYPGSRSNPIPKFHRVVECLKNQTNPNWELVIVSDGCELAMKEYQDHYADDDKIKFAFVAKPKQSLMYAEENGQKYFRGLPRQVGIEISTGDWISYVDSDDFILPNAVEDLIYQIRVKTHKLYPGEEVKAILNRSSIKNELWEEMTRKHIEAGASDIPSSELFEIDGLGGKWKSFEFPLGKANLATVSVIHERNWPPHNWKDSTGSSSEDMIFIKPMTMNPLAKHSDFMSVPYYVICHHSKKWDY